MNYEHIIFSLEGGVARVTLNRPERLNSFNAAMHLELRDAMRRIREGHARVLLLTGAGRGFCAGQDLSDRNVSAGSEPVDLGYTIETYYRPLVLGLRNLEMPVICAVNGVAAGAGASIALGCDIVLAARSASFIQAFCKLGLVPDAGGTWVLPRLVGTARAMGLAMLGDKLSAEQAEAWGLIWKRVDDDKLMAEAEKLAVHFSTAPTKGLVFTRQAIHASGGNSLEQQLELERALQQQLGFGHDYREGVAAFMEKRGANFTGGMMALTPQEIAERCTEIMWPDDHAARGLGIVIVSTTPGGATVTMPVRQDMVNGHGICHGGFIFALADTNFAYACNSFNHRTVASGGDINFVAPAYLGDKLTAIGSVRHQGGRSGIYDIEVTNQNGKTIALFRGRSSRIKGHFLEESDFA